MPFDPARWLGYAMAWARRRRPRHWDWEQAAIDGLYRATVTYDATRWRYTHKTWLDWQLRGSASDLARYHGRPRRAGDHIARDLDRIPSREDEPWLSAAIAEANQPIGD